MFVLMEILIILLLILLNGVFSMSEIALVSSRRFTLESAAKKGNGNARKALELSANPNTFLSTVQIGITLIGILTGIYSGEKLTTDLVYILNSSSLLAPYSETLAVVIIVVIITYFSIVFGELIPKRIGLAFPETIAMLVARPMNALSLITKPFIWLLAKTNDLVLGLLRIKEKDGIVTEEEIKSIIADSTSVGEIQEIEEDIVKRVFALGDRKAGELMTHRSDLTYLDINDGLQEIKRKVESEPHAVYPVIDKSPDKLLGVVSINQVFTKSFLNEEFNLEELIQKPLYVQENMAAYKVLEKFKEHKVHLVMVVDEYGSVEGVLSIADVVDELIGDISSSATNEDADIIKRNDDSWLVSGQCQYYEFINYFKLSDAEEPDGFTTMGGLILKHVNHYPVTGEKIRWKNFELEIVDMDKTRIDKILVSKLVV
jgi:putative hemolysin